jgi:hypothetical protein
MSTYAHLSPHPKFQLPSQKKFGGPRAVDNLVEEVTEYIRHGGGGGSRNPFEQNLIGERGAGRGRGMARRGEVKRGDV